MKPSSKIERLILGTVQLGTHYGVNNTAGRPSREESLRILTRAKELGVKALDAAEAYGDVHDILREATQKGLSFKIFSKFNLQTPLEDTVRRCLGQLGLPYLDLFSFHSFKDLQNFSDWSILEKLQTLGLVKKWGVSVYTPEEAIICAKKTHIKTLQIPFNLLDNHSRWEEVLQELKAEGKEIHVRSIFLQGLFMREPHQLVGYFAPLRRYLEELTDIATSQGHTLRELAMHFPFSEERIDGVLMGVDSLPQLELNLKDIKQDLSDTIWSEIRKIKISMQEQELLNPANWPKK